MSCISSCPKCGKQVTIPGGVSAAATVCCPLCRNVYVLKAALDLAPPELIVIDMTADEQPDVLRFNEQEQKKHTADSEVEPATEEISHADAAELEVAEGEEALADEPVFDEPSNDSMTETLSFEESDVAQRSKKSAADEDAEQRADQREVANDETLEFPADELALDTQSVAPQGDAAASSAESAPTDLGFGPLESGFDERAEEAEFELLDLPSNEFAAQPADKVERLPRDEPVDEAARTADQVDASEADTIEFELPDPEDRAPAAPSFDVDPESATAGVAADASSVETEGITTASKPRRRIPPRMVLAGTATVCLALICLVVLWTGGFGLSSKKPEVASLPPTQPAAPARITAAPAHAAPTEHPGQAALPSTQAAPERPTLSQPDQTPAAEPKQDLAEGNPTEPATARGPTPETPSTIAAAGAGGAASSESGSSSAPSTAAPESPAQKAPSDSATAGGQNPTTPGNPADQAADTSAAVAPAALDQSNSSPPAEHAPDAGKTETRTANRVPGEYTAPPMDGDNMLNESKPANGNSSDATVAAGIDQVGPHITTTYTANNIEQALTNLRNVTEQIAAAGSNAESLKKLRTPYFLALYRLAETVTFLDPVDSKPEQTQRVEEAVLQAIANPISMTDIGRAAAKWLSLSEAKRGAQNGGFLFQNGICLAGTVRGIERRGRVFDTQVALAGGGPIVAVLSADEPKLHPGENVVVLGSIVENAADQVSGYQGGEDRVVWSRLLLAAPGKQD